jgi:hypothetical protein
MLKQLAQTAFPNFFLRYKGARTLFNNATFNDDGLLTINSSDFLKDPLFIRSFAAGLDGIPDELVKSTFSVIRWRAHVCCWAANQAKHKDGDFVECGVWYGVLARTITEYVDFDSLAKKFYLMDAWGDLKIGNSSSYVPDIFEAVKARFHGIHNVEFVRGLIPDTLDRVQSKKIAFLSIDMNCVEPEREALNFFYEKIVPGGIIYFDDYGVAGHEDQKSMVDHFFKDKPESIMYIPSGQGLVVKI